MAQIDILLLNIKRDVFWPYRYFGRVPVKVFTKLIAVLLFAFLFIVPQAVHAEDVYVVLNSPQPWFGTIEHPFPTVEYAVGYVFLNAPGSTIWIAAGEYSETLTIDTPCILRTTGGTVSIGPAHSSTSIEILTLNTLLFGEATGPNWQDTQRAKDIGDIMNALNPDLVGLQEVWDPYRLSDLFGRSGCDYYEYGSYNNCHLVDTHNSGLALLSEYPLSNFAQVCWDDCDDTQCFASKGFVRATIVKDGFSITVFNVHTQAYPTDEDVQVREAQIEQLRDAVSNWRLSHPGHVVFVIGDFNIIGGTNEYDDNLVAKLAPIGGKDAFSGGPPTYSKSNLLAAHIARFTSDDNDPFPPDDQRLDYIFYFPSHDGSVSVVKTDIEVYEFRGSALSGCTTLLGFSEMCCNDCIEKSDHWSVRGLFQLVRQ